MMIIFGKYLLAPWMESEKEYQTENFTHDFEIRIDSIVATWFFVFVISQSGSLSHFMPLISFYTPL